MKTEYKNVAAKVASGQGIVAAEILLSGLTEQQADTELNKIVLSLAKTDKWNQIVDDTIKIDLVACQEYGYPHVCGGYLGLWIATQDALCLDQDKELANTMEMFKSLCACRVRIGQDSIEIRFRVIREIAERAFLLMLKHSGKNDEHWNSFMDLCHMSGCNLVKAMFDRNSTLDHTPLDSIFWVCSMIEGQYKPDDGLSTHQQYLLMIAKAVWRTCTYSTNPMDYVNYARALRPTLEKKKS